MTRILRSIVFSSLALISGVGASDALPGNTNETKLAPIAFLTSSEWIANLPNTPDGKTMAIRARFAWAENQRLVRVSNQFVVNGTPTPYIEGIYFWNPQTAKIEFVWSDADGNLSRGCLVQMEGKLVHEFDLIHPDGKVETYTARVTPNPDGSWGNEILKRVDGKLTPFVQVRYEPAAAKTQK